ncbi:hypothetical protein HB779_14895 [Phyllobacterium sp. 628]|uniref:hypothetical protein n=1 Tax=Phyllobacterium sp. 628 TaxID=2718938 RepID=UPI00166272E4|nr:hypothetical protein [Phyllobacterium sp. 628]QND53046.1 hypothetical protein HB779_14895 [Phyllobacterium sp. 628]
MAIIVPLTCLSSGAAGLADDPKQPAQRLDIRTWLSEDEIRANPHLVITVTFSLTQSGMVEGTPEVKATGSDAAVLKKVTDRARKAVLDSAPYQLPPEKYDLWKNVELTFYTDPAK